MTARPAILRAGKPETILHLAGTYPARRRQRARRRLQVTFIYVTFTVALALAVTYALAVARVPQIEACFWVFLYALGWVETRRATVRSLARTLR